MEENFLLVLLVLSSSSLMSPRVIDCHIYTHLIHHSLIVGDDIYEF